MFHLELTHYFAYSVYPPGFLETLKAAFLLCGECILIATLTTYNNRRASVNGEKRTRICNYFIKSFFSLEEKKKCTYCLWPRKCWALYVNYSPPLCLLEWIELEMTLSNFDTVWRGDQGKLPLYISINPYSS